MKVREFTRNAVWAATFIGVATNIEFDSVGNYYVSGNSTTVISNVNLNPDGSVVLPSGIGVYIIKYNSVGTAIWCKKFSCTNPNGNRVLIDTSDNVYFLGHAVFGSAVDINGDGTMTITSSGTKIAGFIVKYNSSGVGLFARTFITESFAINVAEIDKTNNIYIGGRYWVPIGQANIDLGNSVTLPYNNNGNNNYLAKFNSSGVALAARNFGTLGPIFNTIAIDSENNMYAGGQYYLANGSTISLNNSGSVFLPSTYIVITQSPLTSATSIDGFIAKFDTTDLQGLWTKQLKGKYINSSSNGTSVNKMIIDTNDNMYVCGQYRASSNGNLDFNGDGSVVLPTTSSSSGDIYLAKYNVSGTALWARSLAIKNTANDIARYMDLDPSGNIYLIGQASTAADSPDFTINGNVINTVGLDSIVLKYNPSGDIVEYKLISGSGTDEGRSIVYDHYSNSYVVYGNYLSTSIVNLNGDNSVVLPIANTSSVFLIKFGQNTPVDIPLPSVTNISEIISEYNASNVEIGETLKLTVRTNPSNSVVTWDSSDTAFAIVDSYGIVTGITEGVVTITATYGAYSVTKTINVIQPRIISSNFDTINGVNNDMILTLSGVTSGSEIIWVSNDTSVVYILSTDPVNSEATVRTVSTGTVIITAIYEGRFYSKTLTVV